MKYVGLIRRVIFLLLIDRIFNPVSAQLISGGQNGEIVIWNDLTGTVTHLLEQHQESVTALKMIRNDMFASASSDWVIMLWNIATGNLEDELHWHVSAVLALETFEATDGTKFLLSGDANNHIVIWNPWNSTSIGRIMFAHDGAVRCLKWLGPNTGYFASGGEDGFIKIWDTATFKFLRRLEKNSGSVTTLDILSNGYLVSGSDGGLVSIWNLNTAVAVSSFEPITDSGIHRVRELDNGDLAITGERNLIYFLNPSNTGLTTRTIGSSGTYLYDVLTYNNGQIIATTYLNKIPLINSTSRQVIRTYTSPASEITCLEHASSYGSVKTASIRSSSTQVTSIVAGGLDDGNIQLWCANSGRLLLTLEGHIDGVNSLKLINKTVLASASKDKNIKLWNLSQGSCYLTLSNHTKPVTSIDFLTTGYLVSVSNDFTFVIWDINSGNAVHKGFVGLEELKVVKQISSSLFAIGGTSGKIHLYNINTYLKDKTLLEHINQVTSLEVLNSGRLASSSIDSSVIIWDSTYSGVYEYFEPFEDEVYRVRALSDGTLVVCGSSYSLQRYSLNPFAGVVLLNTWDNIASDYSCNDLFVANETIVFAESNKIKLINVTNQEVYLDLSYTNPGVSLTCVAVLTVTSAAYTSPSTTSTSTTITATSSTTTTTTSITTSLAPSSTTTTVLPTTSTPSATTSITASLAPSSPQTTILPVTITSNFVSSTGSTNTPVSVSNQPLFVQSFFKVLKNSDMSFMIGNMLFSSMAKNYLKCSLLCNGNSNCNAFVFEIVNKNCSTYRQLTNPLVYSSGSTVYFKF